MWSVGCLFALMVQSCPLFKCNHEKCRGHEDCEIGTLDCILRKMGTPDEKVWPGVSKLPNFSMIGFREYIGEDLRQSFSSMDEDGFNLMMRMLTLDPKQRITAQEALEHEYFNE